MRSWCYLILSIFYFAGHSQTFTVGSTCCNYNLVNKSFTTPLTYGLFQEYYYLDIDGDLVNDIGIRSTHYSCQIVPSGPCTGQWGNDISINLANNVTFVYGASTTPSCSAANLPKNLTFGSALNSTLNWSLTTSPNSSSVVFSAGNGGLYCGVQTNPYYLGFRKILPTTDTIYGWIRLDSNFPGKVIDYAYTCGTYTAAAPTSTITTPSTSLCQGDVLSLNANPSGGVFTGSGVTGNQFSSNSLSPGTYFVTYALPNPSGCTTSTSAISLSVIPSPTAAFTNTQTSICNGNSITLNATPSGGIFSGPGVSGNIFNSTSTGTGTFIANYSYTNTNGCIRTASLLLKVNDPPSFTNITPTVCNGTSLALTANPPGGTFSGTGVLANTFYAPGTGVYTLSYTPSFNTGCSINTAIYTLTVLPMLNTLTVNVTSSALPSCPGQSVVLTPSGADNYTWYGPWIGGISAPNLTVNPTTSTMYYAVGSSTTGCNVNNTFAFNQIVDQPTVSISPVAGTLCPGSAIQLTSSGCSTYSWSTGATGSVCPISPTVTTSYSVVGTSTASCKDTAYITLSVHIPTVSVTASNYSICAGNQVNLFVSGATSYTWSSGCNISTCQETPTTSTTYTVIGMNIGGCSDTGFVTINVDNSNLILNINSSANPICAGSLATLNLSGSTSGYLIQSIDNSFMTTTNQSTIQINPSVTTSYVIYGHTLPSGCTATGFFTQNVLSNVIVNVSSPTNSLCPGQNITLTASGAPSYSWSTGATTSSIIVSPTVSTTYTLTGINTNSCTNSISFYQTVVNPSVTIASNSSTICVGSNATLTAQGALSYSWSTGSTTQTIVVNPTITTTYSVTGSNYGGCSDTGFFTETVLPSPPISAVSNQSTFCIGDTAIITLTGGATTYDILSNALGWTTMTVSGPTIVITPTVTSTYTVNNGCSAPVVFTINVASCVGVQDLDRVENNVVIFPNPNNGEFEMRGTKEEIIYVTNELGQLIDTKKLNQENNYSIKINNLQNGVYFVGNKFSRQKVVVIK